MTDSDLFAETTLVAKVSSKLPWHTDTWSGLTRDPERLAHGLLLLGRPGLGKGLFAHRFAQWLLCLAPAESSEPCGGCQSCQLFAAGTHPDFVLLKPAEEGRAITVDQIRELNSFLALKPHTAKRKIVVIDPADGMNVNAANSLLKQLEEPPLGSILLLVTSMPHRLPATVRSRCAKVPFAPPPSTQGLAWLEERGVPKTQASILLALAAGAPLRAFDLADTGMLKMRESMLADLESLAAGKGDVVGSASRWKEFGAGRALKWLQLAIGDLVKISVTESDKADLINADLVTRLRTVGKRIKLNDLFSFLDDISASCALLSGPLDEQLMLESILVRWARLAR